MKQVAITLAAVIALFLVGCSNDTTNPMSSDALAGASLQGGSDASVAGSSEITRRGNRIEGLITAVDVKYGTVTIRGIVVQTDASTKVERNGFHATLSQFKVGDKGQARWNAGEKIAFKVESIGD